MTRIEGYTSEGFAPMGCRFVGVYLGNGTGSGAYMRMMDERGIKYDVIDERMTTLEGRSLYWLLHPPRGVMRLIPASLRVPPRAVDDLAAWAILKRALSGDRLKP
jgi:hypothetical protein